LSGEKVEELDWASWRGPDNNGISKETGWNPQALKGGPKVAWQTNVGQGWSAVAIKGPDLFTMGSDGARDVVYCLNVADGKEKWKYSYPCNPGNYPGPRCTPVWDEGRIYTLSREGHLFCLDAAKGKVKWKRHIIRDFGVKNLKWGFACSARIEGRALLLNAGERGLALDKKTGRKFWSSTGTGSYAVPVVFMMGKRKCVAVFSEKAIMAVDFRTGTKLWAYPWITSHDVNAADPVIYGNKMFISSGYGKGCAMLDFSRGRLNLDWRNAEIASHFASSVIIDDHIYGPHGNAGQRSAGVKCLDAKTGEARWNEPLGFCSLIAADGHLIILNERGELRIAKADKGSYVEVSRCQALERNRRAKCWTAPVLLRGKIYCRNSLGDLVCIDVGK
jgi:outer membrane protein assembly factor BamB